MTPALDPGPLVEGGVECGEAEAVEEQPRLACGS